METLFTIAMLLGLMKPHAEPPKVAAANIEQPQVSQRGAGSERRASESDKSRPHSKSEWPLGY